MHQVTYFELKQYFQIPTANAKSYIFKCNAYYLFHQTNTRKKLANEQIFAENCTYQYYHIDKFIKLPIQSNL